MDNALPMCYRLDVKAECREQTRRAIKEGKLIRSARCSVCGHTGKIQAHHTDYSDPLAVVWLCFPCHRRIHGYCGDVVSRIIIEENGIYESD
jgi:hypothetical protein